MFFPDIHETTIMPPKSYTVTELVSSASMTNIMDNEIENQFRGKRLITADAPYPV